MFRFAQTARKLAAALALLALPAGAFADAASSLHVRQVEVIDRGAPEGPTRVFSTLVPADWKTEGGIYWTGGGCELGPKTVWSASSPDEAYSIGFLPTTSWGAGSHGRASGCHDGNFENAEQAVRAYFALNPQVRVSNLTFERPDDLRPFVSQLDQMIRTTVAGMGQGRADGVLVRGRISAEGKTHEMTLIMVTTHTVFAFDDGWGGQYWNSNSNVILAIGMTAPVGEATEDVQAFELISNSMRWDQNWQRQVNAWWARVNRDNRETAAAISRINTETNAEIMDIITTGHANREAIRDAGHERQVRGIRETDVWTASDGRVELPDTHNHVWELDDGTFVLTDDEFFNPTRDLSMGGEEIRRVQ